MYNMTVDQVAAELRKIDPKLDVKYSTIAFKDDMVRFITSELTTDGTGERTVWETEPVILAKNFESIKRALGLTPKRLAAIRKRMGN